MHHNRIFSLILLISVLLFVTPCNSLPAAEPVLKADFRHRPPEMVVQGNSISGPLKDILEIAAKNIGYRIEWRIVPFSESLEGLKTGQVDIVPRTLRKPERESFVNYLGPISIQRKDILFCVPKGKEKRITQYGDLKNMRVGVKPKTAYFEKFDSDTAINKVKTDGDQNLARLLADGKVDAIAVLDRQPLEQAFARLGFENYGYADFRHAHAIANYYGMSKQSPHADLFDELNQALSVLKASGQIDGVFYKYGLTKDLGTGSAIGLTAAEKNWLKEHPGPFRVSNEMGFPPFNFNENGKPKGFSIAYMGLLARKLNIPVDYVSGPSWDGFMKMMRDHDMDIMLNIIRSPERQKYIAFTKPYIKNPIVIVTRRDQIFLKQMDDLKGKMVAVPKGFYYQEIIEKEYPDVNLMPAKDQGEALRKVATGEADATIGSLAVNNYLISKNFLSNLRVSGVIPVDTMKADYSIGVRKDWGILAGILQKASDAVTQEEFLRLQKKWLGDLMAEVTDQKAEKSVELTPAEKAFIQKHGAPIISGAEMDWPPFDFVENETVSGFSNELLRLAAQKLGLPLDFAFGFTWAELLAKFKKGEIDILPAIYKTPERIKDMAFTKEYAANPTVLVVQEESRGLKSLKDLDGKKLATIEGFSITSFLLEKHPEIEVLPVKNVLEGLKAVSLKRADAFIGSLGVISYILSENVLPYVKITDEIVIDQTDATRLHMAVLKDRAVLRDILQKGLDAVSVEEMRRLKMKWLPYKFGQSPQSKVLRLTTEEKNWLKAHKEIRLGIDPVALPFEAISKEGVYEGISSEYVALLNEKLGVDMRPVTGLNWQEVIAAAGNREIDVLPFVAVTQERKEFLRFTKPYIHFQVAAVTRQDAPFIAGLKELKDHRVAVVKGYFVYALLEKDYPELTLVPVDNIEQGLRAVSDGKVAAVVDNSAAIIYHIRKLGLKNLKVAANTPYRPGISFGVRKDWPELVAILDKALETIPEAERERIANRWINIQFADRTDWDFVIKASSAAAVVIVLILGVILFWNRRLAREVGERKRAEERFQAIAATTPGAIVQLRFDADGTPDYLYLSAKAEAFFGKPPQQVINEKCRLPWHPEDAPRIKGEVRANLLAEAEMNYVGRIVPEEGVIRWIRLNASPSRTGDGDVIYNGFILDITERKQAEQEFLKSERKIKAMSQAAEDALIMIDGQGRVLFWNPAAERLFGHTEAEAMGMGFHKIAAPQKYHEKIEKGLAHFAQAGQGPVLGTTTEVTAQNRQGEKFPVEVTLSSFRMDNEWFAVGTVRDITDRKRAEQELRERMEDLERFNQLTVGREEKMIQLKEEINELRGQLGMESRYKIVQ